MDRSGGGKCGRGTAAASVALVGLLAGCAPTAPPPVVAAAPQPTTITIERGQTLSGIAQNYKVPLRDLAQANHLSPPYRILAGEALLIPAAGAGPPAAALPPAAAVVAPTAPVAAATPPPRTAAPPPPVGPPAAPPPPAARAVTPPPQSVAAAAGAPKTRLAETSTAPQPAAPPPAAPGPPAQPQPPAAPAPHGGTFVWPVHGHILEGFGAGPDGTHNDGINIAAARGAPVQAVDAGVVAYAGNELRGYGNLLLIKHPGGWISAYAHCDAILVKPGQKIARGQVIARVGSSGSVGTPQLHFELRRGNKPVDPRAYLSPLPSAATAPAHSG